MPAAGSTAPQRLTACSIRAGSSLDFARLRSRLSVAICPRPTFSRPNSSLRPAGRDSRMPLPCVRMATATPTTSSCDFFPASPARSMWRSTKLDYGSLHSADGARKRAGGLSSCRWRSSVRPLDRDAAVDIEGAVFRGRLDLEAGDMRRFSITAVAPELMDHQPPDAPEPRSSLGGDHRVVASLDRPVASRARSASPPTSLVIDLAIMAAATGERRWYEVELPQPGPRIPTRSRNLAHQQLQLDVGGDRGRRLIDRNEAASTRMAGVF